MAGVFLGIASVLSSLSFWYLSFRDWNYPHTPAPPRCVVWCPSSRAFGVAVTRRVGRVRSIKPVDGSRTEAKAATHSWPNRSYNELEAVLVGAESLNFNGAFIVRLVVLAFVFGSVLWATSVNQVQGLDKVPTSLAGAVTVGLNSVMSGFMSVALFVLIFGIFMSLWTAPSWEESLFDIPLNMPHFLLTFVLAFGAGLLVGAIWRGPQALVGSVAAFATALGGWLALKLMMYLFRTRVVWQTSSDDLDDI